jgi:hypothetical protein
LASKFIYAVEFKTIKQLAQVAAKLQLKRLEKKLSQKDLAKKNGGYTGHGIKVGERRV